MAFVIATMVLVVTLLLVFRQLTRYKPKPKLPKGFLYNRTVALELAESPQVVGNILNQPGSDARGEIRKETYLDFVFIASYWLLFIGLSCLLVQRSLASYSWFAPPPQSAPHSPRSALRPLPS